MTQINWSKLRRFVMIRIIVVAILSFFIVCTAWDLGRWMWAAKRLPGTNHFGKTSKDKDGKDTKKYYWNFDNECLADHFCLTEQNGVEPYRESPVVFISAHASAYRRGKNK